jgi:adenylate cyclase class 2
MKYEVEQKFPVADLTALAAQLSALGATISESRSELDHYYAHPSRDFSQTDEALRIRRADRANYITYKGPKIDATTKPRREIELTLSPDEEQTAGWESILEALGFTPVGEVCKYRRKAAIPWQGRSVEGSLDEVIDVGTFFELELMAEEEDVEAAKACIASLAEHLGLARSERLSYLELLLRAGDR